MLSGAWVQKNVEWLKEDRCDNYDYGDGDDDDDDDDDDGEDDDDNDDDDDDPLTPSVWQHSLQASPLERTAMVGDLL